MRYDYALIRIDYDLTKEIGYLAMDRLNFRVISIIPQNNYHYVYYEYNEVK